MYMKESEICLEYRQAKNKQKQISVLADMNACTQAEIIALLAKCGEQVESGAGGRGADTMKSQSWDTEKAMALYNEGKTDQQIAEAVFISDSMVGVWRRKQGLPANRKTPKKQSAAKPPVTPASPPTATGPVALSVELDGWSFALRAPDLEGAVRAYACAGRLLESMTKEAGVCAE